MSVNSKKMKSAMSAGSLNRAAKRVVTKAVDRAAKTAQKKAAKTSSALAVVARRVGKAPSVKHARTMAKNLTSRTTRLLKSNPVPVLVGASALGFVLAKMKHII